MTIVIFNIDDVGESAYIDICGHAGDHDVCTMISTVVNTIICGTEENGNLDVNLYEPGHTNLTMDRVEMADWHVLIAAKKTLKAIAEQHPEYIKVY